MISKEQAKRFAKEWIEAWNAHNLEAILAHYSDDFEMTSPFIVAVMNEPTGTIKGRRNVGTYWQKSLDRFPDLKFELSVVLGGVNSITIYYKSSMSGSTRLAAEVFFFDSEGKVNRAFAHYNED